VYTGIPCGEGHGLIATEEQARWRGLICRQTAIVPIRSGVHLPAVGRASTGLSTRHAWARALREMGSSAIGVKWLCLVLVRRRKWLRLVFFAFWAGGTDLQGRGLRFAFQYEV
jgi:hypothetical protein